MRFAVTDYYELLALHRVVMEAKFSDDPNDRAIQGSPFVAAIANRVLEALIAMDIEKEGESAGLRWQNWRQVTPDYRQYQITKTILQSNTVWKTWDFDDQVKYVKDLVSPLQISDELIETLLGMV
jgi:hypothetical protein